MATVTRNSFIIGILVLALLIGGVLAIGAAGNHWAPAQCQNKCQEQADREYGHPTSTYGKILKNNYRGRCNFLCWIN